MDEWKFKRYYFIVILLQFLENEILFYKGTEYSQYTKYVFARINEKYLAHSH